MLLHKGEAGGWGGKKIWGNLAICMNLLNEIKWARNALKKLLRKLYKTIFILHSSEVMRRKQWAVIVTVGCYCNSGLLL
jgi:hypothetical protein